jgi:hypothetical protein
LCNCASFVLALIFFAGGPNEVCRIVHGFAFPL